MVIDAILRLPPDRQRQLLRLLDRSPGDLDEFSDDELSDEIVWALRETLMVPSEGDLPEYARRRLVELAKRDFGLGGNFDSVSDVELAAQLVDAALERAQQLTEDPPAQEEFAKFLRTKDADARDSWLLAAKRASALLEGNHFDRAAVARSLRQQRLLDEAYKVAALELVSSLPPAREESDRKRFWTRAAELGVPLATALAAPLGVVAGGLFMAGLATQDRADATPSRRARPLRYQVVEERQKRARRSRMVQQLMTVCAFLTVASVEADDLSISCCSVRPEMKQSRVVRCQS